MTPTTKQSGNRTNEQRQGERRHASLQTFWGALSHQRRRLMRRTDDQVNNYIDWYGHWPLAATFTIILLCFADAFLTIVLLSKGAVELNILMDWLIQHDVHTFAVVKMATTGIALIVLVMHFNFRIYRFILVHGRMIGPTALQNLHCRRPHHGVVTTLSVLHYLSLREAVLALVVPTLTTLEVDRPCSAWRWTLWSCLQSAYWFLFYQQYYASLSTNRADRPAEGSTTDGATWYNRRDE